MKSRKVIRFVKKYAYALASCAYTFTLGVLSARGRDVITRICNLHGYDPKLVEAAIPKVELAEVVPEESAVQIREAAGSYGNVRLLELVVIAKLIRRQKPCSVFEIGTFDGRTALNMAANCPSEARIHTLDLPREMLSSTRLSLAVEDKPHIDKEESGSRYLGTDCEGKITQLYGDSATFDFSPFHNAVDFVFVDGSHSYEYVKNDSEQAFRLLKNGKGTILWHDYHVSDGVTQALNELYLRDKRFGGLKHINQTSLVSLIVG